ncbi:MAG: class I tRNA ligase family protein [Deltaproteobacteria bacterium]|nr:class I tRNA ligase family protein [Deltaproteobacteria bacterium]
MFRIFNTFGKHLETFQPVNTKTVTIFTCGPSVYQKSHIGNFRTFLFEDIVVRYLEYLGYQVERGMNITDIEDKAIKEAENIGTSVKALADPNIETFLKEMRGLKMKIPNFLPRASETVEKAVEIIERLVDLKIAYWHDGNCYFDPLKYPGFGELYGLDMQKWPERKKRFHKDTYPGMRWNRGDFILWHRYKEGDTAHWDTRIGKGRPAWNIQDPSMIIRHFNETLSLYCGGIDNLIRHHDYTRAVLESIRPYPMAKYWLHCHHLHVDGKKMSKSIGNILYTDDLQEKGYSLSEIRFFLIYGHYRIKLNYSDKRMQSVTERLRKFKEQIKKIENKAGSKANAYTMTALKINEVFQERMNDDLDVKGAFDNVSAIVLSVDIKNLTSSAASEIMKALKDMDKVLKIIY